MAIEAYRIASNLVMDPTKITGPIGLVIEAFERLLRVQRNVQTGVNEMASGIRAGRTAASSLADQLERAAKAAQTVGRNTAGVGVGAGVAPGARTSPVSVATSPQGNRAPGTALVPLGIGGAATRSGGTSLAPVGLGATGAGGIPLNFRNPTVLPTPGGHEFLMAGLGAASSIFDAGADAGSLVAKMQASHGFNAAIVQSSKDMARDLVGKVPGLSYSQGLELILQTSSFTGDPGEALKLVPTLARNAQVLAQFGHGDAIDQIEKAVKAGELTGLTDRNGQINTPKLIDFVNRLTSVDVASGGTMDMGKYLTSIRQYGVGADAASLDFLTATLPAYQKIMGEAKAGTAFSSLLQSLSSTKPNTQNKSYMAEQARIGLRDANHNVVQGDLLRTDPDAWFTTVLLPAFLRDQKLTPQSQLAEFYRIFPRQTMVRAGAAGIFDQGIIEKESNRNREQMRMGGAPLDALLANSPNNQIKAFGSALNLLEVTLADPAMGNATGALKTLTGALLGFSQFSKDHPTASNALVTGAVTSGATSYMLGSALIYGYFAKGVYDIAKWAKSALVDTDKITAGEPVANGLTGTSIVGRVLRGLAGTSRFFGKAAILPLLYEGLYSTPYELLFGSASENRVSAQVGAGPGGLVGMFKEIRDMLAGKADLMTGRPITMTGTLKVDGKALGTFTAKGASAGVQSGTTGHDGSMSPVPAGPAWGDGK